jgi:leader peptidase (prepilin peptidase)/N-methyltransferase
LLIMAPFVGSFLGVLIRRLPQARPVVLGRSECESCGRVLPARDLMPLASFAKLGGRCRTCRAPIAPFHIAIELAAIGVAVCAVLAEQDPSRLWADCALGWALLALAWIDWDHMLLPDVLTLPLVVLGLGVTALREPDQIADHAVAAISGYVAIRAVAAGDRALRGREGIGQGDAKLLAAAGAWVGLGALSAVLLGAALLSLVALIPGALRGDALNRTSEIPFGPGLCLALWIVWMST